MVATDEASIIQLRSSQTQVGTTLVQQISLMEHSSPHKLTGDWDLRPPLSEQTRESSDDPGFFEVSPLNSAEMEPNRRAEHADV